MSTTDPNRGEGMLYRKRGSTIWTARLYIAVLGRHRKRSTGTSDEQKARRWLAKWRAEIIGGVWVPDADKTTFAQLEAMLIADYVANNRRSMPRIRSGLLHLRPVFGHLRARAISRDRIVEYARQRRDEDATPATINRELSCLKRMFTLGRQAGKLALTPHIPMLKEAAPRAGFFEREQFEAVLARLSEDLRAPVHAAFLTGWRLRSELLTRQWRHVDFTNGWIRLDPGETKNGEGRMFPLVPELRAVLERQRARTTALEREQGRIIASVFHRAGVPIRDMRTPWAQACRSAGVPGRLMHDMRRTAVRNLERAGVPRSTSMKLVGHQTESVYRRYAIVDEAMLREGAEKLARLAELQSASVPFSVPPALRSTSPAP